MNGEIDQKVPGYKTSGAHIELDTDIETQLQNKNVTFTIVARTVEGKPTKDFSVSFSTNANGNSGWKTFRALSAPSAFSFDYNVPELVNGGGDYIGLGPFVSNDSGFEVLAIGVKINE